MRSGITVRERIAEVAVGKRISRLRRRRGRASDENIALAGTGYGTRRHRIAIDDRFVLRIPAALKHETGRHGEHGPHPALPRSRPAYPPEVACTAEIRD